MSTPTPTPAPAFTSYQKFMIAILAFLQFTIILDFMILSPLGAMLMRDLAVPAASFGLVVSVYAFAAGISGLLAAGFADRFDRKRLLLFFYAGFLVGTLLCGLAPTYRFLLAARIVTGVFGGVIGSIVLAIVADLFPMQTRGRVMGFVQTAFAASQVMGIPLGLLLANRWGWHAPFLLVVAVASTVGIVIIVRMRPIRGHLQQQRHENPFQHLAAAVAQPHYLQAYAGTCLLVTGGFMLMPFSSAFTIHNMGISFDGLPIIYLVTGLFSIFTGPLVGRLADHLGKFRLFVLGSILSMTMVAIYTHLGVTPIALVIAVNVILFVGITSRMISSQALMSAVPDVQSRGAFMAINASIQQISGGIASGVAGLIVSQTPEGKILHYGTLGYVVMAAMVAAIVLFGRIDRIVAARAVPAPLRTTA